jgi:hypothetical protein
MLSFTGSLKVFIALEPCDMRKGFEGLHAAVASGLDEDVRGGALFVFSNRRRTRLKVLYFDGTGLWLRPLRCSPTASTCTGRARAAGMSVREQKKLRTPLGQG